MISNEYREAMQEILEILEHSDEDIVKKIPKKLIEFWQKNKLNTYTPKFNHSKPIYEMNLKKKTKTIISVLYMNYLCNENEKKIIMQSLIDNEEKYQKELREKYNTNDIFKRKKI